MFGISSATPLTWGVVRHGDAGKGAVNKNCEFSDMSVRIGVSSAMSLRIERVMIMNDSNGTYPQSPPPEGQYS